MTVVPVEVVLVVEVVVVVVVVVSVLSLVPTVSDEDAVFSVLLPSVEEAVDEVDVPVPELPVAVVVDVVTVVGNVLVVGVSMTSI